jgi:hypothetical protein
MIAGIAFLFFVFGISVLKLSGYVEVRLHSAEIVPAAMELMDLVPVDAPEQKIDGMDPRIPAGIQEWQPYFAWVSHETVTLLKHDSVITVYRSRPTGGEWSGLRVTDRLYWYRAGGSPSETLVDVAIVFCVPAAALGWIVYRFLVILKGRGRG